MSEGTRPHHIREYVYASRLIHVANGIVLCRQTYLCSSLRVDLMEHLLKCFTKYKRKQIGVTVSWVCWNVRPHCEWRAWTRAPNMARLRQYMYLPQIWYNILISCHPTYMPILSLCYPVCLTYLGYIWQSHQRYIDPNKDMNPYDFDETPAWSPIPRFKDHNILTEGPLEVDLLGEQYFRDCHI